MPEVIATVQLSHIPAVVLTVARVCVIMGMVFWSVAGIILAVAAYVPDALQFLELVFRMSNLSDASQSNN
jgi:hypothetical protein